MYVSIYAYIYAIHWPMAVSMLGMRFFKMYARVDKTVCSSLVIICVSITQRMKEFKKPHRAYYCVNGNFRACIATLNIRSKCCSALAWNTHAKEDRKKNDQQYRKSHHNIYRCFLCGTHTHSIYITNTL